MIKVKEMHSLHWVVLTILTLAGCTSDLEKLEEFNTDYYPFTAEVDQLLKDTKDGGLCATRYSFIGNTQACLEAADYGATEISPISQETWDSIQEEYSFQSASTFILKEAKAYDFLMINEAHHIAQHRDFLNDLLPDLKKIGYKYLALETLSMMKDRGRYDTMLEERKYPIIHTGFYSKEPHFGKLIRDAASLGFKFIGYDQGSGSDREITGAKNILSALENLPEGKTIVLCGYDHIREAYTGTYWEYALAGRLREYTRKDVLTIQQTSYYGHSQKIFEDSIYQHTELDYPMVLVDEDGNSFDAEENKDWYDHFVWHPRTEIVEGMPGWALNDDILPESIDIPELDAKGPFQVFLFEKDEDISKAVPHYIKEIIKTPTHVVLPLNREKEYQLVITDKTNHYKLELK